MNGATVEQLADILRQDTDLSSRSPLVPIQRGDAARRAFFCIHPAGGNVLCYHHLARYLGSDQPFYGVEPPDLDREDDPYSSIESLASRYLDAIRALQPEGPYLLGGWSFGGLLAFEMAHQLRRNGEQVGLLALLDTVAPMPLPQDFDDAVVLALLTRELGFPHGKNLAVSIRALRALEPNDQVHSVLAQMKEADLVSADTDPGWVRRLLQLYRSSIRATTSYTPKIYPGRITFFRSVDVTPEDLQFLQEVFDLGGNQDALPMQSHGAMPEGNGQATASGWSQDPSAGWEGQATGAAAMPSAPAGLQDQLAWVFDPTLGWSRFSSEPIDLQYVPGTHLTFVADPHVRVLAERLRSLLDEVGART